METKVIATDSSEGFKEAVQKAVELLAAGEAVALPTETVYGLAADAMNPAAVAKIFAAKERPAYDPLIVHLPHKDRVAELAIVPSEISRTVTQLIETFWPGPLTIVLPKAPCVPDAVTAGLPTVALRMSEHPVFRRIITSLARPLAAPSANRFGRISPTSGTAVQKELWGRIPLIVDGGACIQGLESTIVKVEIRPDGKPLIRILRAGPIQKEDLQKFGKVEYAGKQKPRRQRPDTEGTAEAAESADPEPAAPPAPEVPGQLDSHYAPRTPLRLVMDPATFTPEPGKKYALISYRGDPEDGYLSLTDWKETIILSPGSGKMPEAAVRFYHCLRQADECGADEIVSEAIPERGLGIAIMERLRRAASLP